jgi:hypothetical protein
MLEITYNQSTKLPKLLEMLSIREIDKALDRPTRLAAAYVVKNKLNKPRESSWDRWGQMLSHRTGNLSQSVGPSVRTKNGVGSFGTSLKYGRYWELGEVPNQPAREWLSKGTTEYVESGEFVRIFKEELLKALR